MLDPALFKGPPSPDRFYASINAIGKNLVECEKRGVVPPMYRFGAKEVCAGCLQEISPPKKPQRCSACKAVLFCSQECSKRAWNTNVAGGPKHKDLCSDNARHMLRLPDSRAIIEQFPWGRIETDGSFSRDIARGRFGVYGNNVGFWSDSGGLASHRASATHYKVPYTNSDIMKEMLASLDHLDGKDLLKPKHLTDEEGWRLPSDLIPYRDFTSHADKRPILVTDFGEPVKDWDSWYRWRKLPKESTAALLMHYPLSVYQLVVECLKVTHPRKGSVAKRIPLHIHVLGVEVELNYVPLFSELALLLPYHDIKLVLFGFSAHRIVAEARKHPQSVAAKCSLSTPVFSYTAPKECGSGTIDIYLHGNSPIWTPNEHRGTSNSGSSGLYGGRPDVLVACNAGLTTYPDWTPVVRAAHYFQIPFGVTEYTEQSAEHQRAMFPMMIGLDLVKKRDEYVIELNPFQHPGQRAVPMVRLPNLYNGFTMVVFKND
ncbi:hypothetical protein VKT23_000315 [Stygiomarasmius scandens]|uniref:MYND-type domain-containing protein n=1 Tax=Marasmiellus scandens TaxID=2682957 RepID=A0ABR1K441_9AGAR